MLLSSIKGLMKREAMDIVSEENIKVMHDFTSFSVLWVF